MKKIDGYNTKQNDDPSFSDKNLIESTPPLQTSINPKTGSLSLSSNQNITDKIISFNIEDQVKTVVRGEYKKDDNKGLKKCMALSIAVLALGTIILSLYLGFIKNHTPLSYYLGATGIAITFIVTSIFLYYFYCKKDSSPFAETEHLKQDELSSENKYLTQEELKKIDSQTTTNREELTGNKLSDLPIGR